LATPWATPRVVQRPFKHHLPVDPVLEVAALEHDSCPEFHSPAGRAAAAVGAIISYQRRR